MTGQNRSVTRVPNTNYIAFKASMRYRTPTRVQTARKMVTSSGLASLPKLLMLFPFRLVSTRLARRVCLTSLRFLDMGLKALWIAFGAATFYLVAVIAVPTAIVVLRNRGGDISAEAATNVTRLAALLVSALGGALGLRHAQKVLARRGES